MIKIKLKPWDFKEGQIITFDKAPSRPYFQQVIRKGEKYEVIWTMGISLHFRNTRTKETASIDWIYLTGDKRSPYRVRILYENLELLPAA